VLVVCSLYTFYIFFIYFLYICISFICSFLDFLFYKFYFIFFDLLTIFIFYDAFLLSTFSLLKLLQYKKHLFMTLSLVLFLIGVLGFTLNRKNLILLLVSIELILLAVTIIVLVSANDFDDVYGQILGIFIIATAGAESAIGLGILVAYYRLRGTVTLPTVLYNVSYYYLSTFSWFYHFWYIWSITWCKWCFYCFYFLYCY